MATKQPNKAAPAAPPTNVEGVEGAAPDSPLAQFSRELANRYPNRMIRRYVMPLAVRECREIFMMELTSRDEVDAAIYADATMSDVEKRSIRLSADAERRECIRISIVGIGKGETYRHVNHNGEPLAEINDWSGKAWTSLQTYFGMLNGVPTEELAEGLAGAVTVGAFAPPTSATRASAENGK